MNWLSWVGFIFIGISLFLCTSGGTFLNSGNYQDHAVGGFMTFIGIFFLVLSGIIHLFKKKSETEKLKTAVKQCPKCAEEVKKEAVICRFCGFEFPQEVKEG